MVESGLIKKQCSEETGPDLLVVFGIGRDYEDSGARVVRNGDAVDVDAADGPSEDVDRVGRVDVLPLRRDQQREQATKFLRSQNKACTGISVLFQSFLATFPIRSLNSDHF